MSHAFSRAATTRCTSSCSTHGSVGSSVNSGGTETGQFRENQASPTASRFPNRVWSRSRKRTLLVSWDQFDAIEDPAADVGSPLERIPPRSSDDQRLLTRLQPAGQPIVSVITEQAAADGRHRDISDIEIDERIVRIALLGARSPRHCRIFRRPCSHRQRSGSAGGRSHPQPGFASHEFRSCRNRLPS